jgi:SAM-dependent methyltransferase
VIGGLYREPRRDFTPLLRLLDNNHVPPGRALDIGCGEGYLGETLMRRGYGEVWGVEPEPTVAHRAKGRLSGVTVGPFPETAPDQMEPFDLIVFADSLEHIVDPWDALCRAKELLAPGGLLLVSIPNVSHYSVVLELLRNRWSYSDSGLLDRGHVRFFTPQSFRRCLVDAGFRVVSADVVLSKPKRFRLFGTLTGPVLPHLLVYQALFLATPC